METDFQADKIARIQHLKSLYNYDQLDQLLKCDNHDEIIKAANKYVEHMEEVFKKIKSNEPETKDSTEKRENK